VAKAKSRKSQSTDSVYRITELVGTSAVSWEDAVKRAVATASGTLRDLRIADIVKLDVKIDGGKVVAYRARVALSFKYEA
jgi:flavin-binding protein dodecin